MGTDGEAVEARLREWWVFAFYLPTQPAYARVKVWRRLQSIGAASFKNALYLLPATPDALEDLEWTLREVCEAGGQGVIFKATTIEGLSDNELAALFDAAREVQYLELAEQIKDHVATVSRARDRSTPDEVARDLLRFRERLGAIEAIDFFQANGREQAHAQLRALETHCIAVRATDEEVAMAADALSTLKNRTWVTRANVQVDRMASAWLIKRWIDPDGRFKFVTERRYQPSTNELRYDMYEAEYTHDGDRCTFEVLLDLLEWPDTALRRIADSVHDLDLRDHKYQREETAGIKQLLGGIAASYARDEERVDRVSAIFDDLYSSFVRSR